MRVFLCECVHMCVSTCMWVWVWCNFSYEKNKYLFHKTISYDSKKIHICVHAYICTCIYAYMCICIYVFMHICVHVYMCIYILWLSICQFLLPRVLQKRTKWKFHPRKSPIKNLKTKVQCVVRVNSGILNNEVFIVNMVDVEVTLDVRLCVLKGGRRFARLNILYFIYC